MSEVRVLVGFVWSDINLNTVRFVFELLGLTTFAVTFFHGVFNRLGHLIDLLTRVDSTLGFEDEHTAAKPGTVLARLKHQDECTDNLRREVNDFKEELAAQKLSMTIRLARIEGKLGLPMEEP